MTEATFESPVVATHGSTDPAAPLVVLLHGRGSNESDILGRTAHPGALADSAHERAAPAGRPATCGQLDDPAAAGVAERPTDLQERLFDELSGLPGVEVGPSRISVPDARGLTLREGSDDELAFLVPQVREFAHLHPSNDGSLHVPARRVGR